MTKVALAPFPVFYDNDGNPLSGGKVFTYDAGTLVNRATYTDRDGGTPNANPVILDSAGRADIWLDANEPYKIVVKNADESVVVADVDDFYGGADPAQLTLAGIVPATGGTYTGPVSFAGGATFDGTAAQDLATLDSLGLIENIVVNSDMAIWQIGTASVPDATHGFDRFVNLTQTGNATLSQLSQPTDGIPFAMRQLQPDASAKRLGWAQQYEARECIAFRSQQLVFAPKIRCSAAVTVRAAILAWTSTLDAPPRDPVNDWASTTYTAGNFFIAGVIPVAVGAVALAANTWTDIPISSISPGGISAPATMNNLYFVAWTEGTLAQNATLDSSIVRGGRGTNIPIWTPPNPALELAKCQRTFEIGTFNDGSYASAGLQLLRRVPFKVTKRVAPSLLGFSGLVETNASGTALGSPTVDAMNYVYTITATGTGSSTANWTAYAGF